MYKFYVTNPTMYVNTTSFTLLHSDMFHPTRGHPQGVPTYFVSSVDKIHFQM